VSCQNHSLNDLDLMSQKDNFYINSQDRNTLDFEGYM
jgi:hypothetical protein